MQNNFRIAANKNWGNRGKNHKSVNNAMLNDGDETVTLIFEPINHVLTRFKTNVLTLNSGPCMSKYGLDDAALGRW